MLFDVTFLGQAGYLYLLVEHQSSPDRLMAFRLLKYIIAIMEQHLKTTQGMELPLIYPLVFYTGKAKYPYSTDLFDLFGVQSELAREIFFQPFKLIELNKIPDEVLKERLWAGIMELTMKHIFDRDILFCVKDMLSLLQQVEHLDGANYVKTILTYLVKTGEVQDKKLFLETIERGLSPEVNEVIMTIAEQFRTEGFQKGIEQGMEKGREEGREEGIVKGEISAKKVIAKNLLQAGMSCEAVSRFTGLSLQDLQRL
jgi:predicted transposase/invertase (TIGR01784 family)